MSWLRVIVEVVVTLAWLYADFWLFTHPWVQVGGSPWILFGVVTWFGVLFSLAAAKTGSSSHNVA